MEDERTRKMVIDFPIRMKHAEKLIEAFGDSAELAAYVLYRQGFVFIDLDWMPIELVKEKYLNGGKSWINKK